MVASCARPNFGTPVCWINISELTRTNGRFFVRNVDLSLVLLGTEKFIGKFTLNSYRNESRSVVMIVSTVGAITPPNVL